MTPISKPRCLLDLDGVLADFNLSALQLMKARGIQTNPDHFNDAGEPTAWSWVPDKAWDLFDYNFWRSLRPTRDGGQILKAVEAAFGKENVCILTSPVDTEGCLEGKLDWIRSKLPDYKRRFLIGPAKEFCAGPNSVLVDDYDGNVSKFREAGGAAVLIPRPYNKAARLPLEEALGVINVVARWS